MRAISCSFAICRRPREVADTYSEVRQMGVVRKSSHSPHDFILGVINSTALGLRSGVPASGTGSTLAEASCYFFGNASRARRWRRSSMKA